MILAFWIALAGILAAIGVVAAAIAKSKAKPRWGIVPTDHLIKETMRVTGGGKEFPVFVYASTDFAGGHPMPGMIVLPEPGEAHPAFEHWAAMLALQGYTTLAVELASQDLVDGVLAAFPSFMAALAARPGVDASRVGLLAFGTSAAKALPACITHPGVKIACCCAMPAIDDALASSLTTKVILAHCKDDDVVPVDSFTRNKASLGCGPEEYLLLDLGGHRFTSQEAVIAGYVSIPLHVALQPVHQQFTPSGVVTP